MKTIVMTDQNNKSIENLDNDAVIEITEEGTWLFGRTLLMAECKPNNTVVFEDTEPPEDWLSGKYILTEKNGWELNPEWEEWVARTEAARLAEIEEARSAAMGQ